ncbi:MAG: acyl carrier protein [Bacteriovoracaceae bacterium]|jgi:acyl carrier protein|nr:acyl carrier protein [Bacteriovoracaceae bacterium]
MEKQEIVDGVIECVKESLVIEDQEITTNTKLIVDLGADSLDFLDIMFQLEEKFDITLDKEDFNFLKRIDLPEEEAISEGTLTQKALSKLKEYLPLLDENKSGITPADLKDYISVGSIVKLVGQC